MKSIDKVILGGVVVASTIGINYNIASADILSQEIYTTTNRLNMRKGPSTDYTLVGTLDKGVKVKAIEKSSDGKWLKINYNSQNVWVNFAYLQKDKSSNNDIKLDSQYETTANVNIRKGPSTDYTKIIIVPAQTKITPIKSSSDGKWVQINYKNVTGWISAQYIKTVSTTPTEPEKPITGKDYYTTANLNIRDGASTTSSKIGKIPNGTKVSVVDFNSNKTWAKVVYNNKTGWVSAQYLSTKSQEPEQKEDTYWTGTTTQNLNMRKGPSTDYSIIITIPKNSDVKIYETKSGWAKIKYKSYEGYCSASFIK